MCCETVTSYQACDRKTQVQKVVSSAPQRCEGLQGTVNRPCAGLVPESHSSRGFCPWGGNGASDADTPRLVSMPGESRPRLAPTLISSPWNPPLLGTLGPPTHPGRTPAQLSIISNLLLFRSALSESTSHPLPPCQIEASCKSSHRDRDRLDTSISDTDVRLILRAKSIFPRSCTAVTSTAQRRPRRIFNLKQLFRGHKTRSIY